MSIFFGSSSESIVNFNLKIIFRGLPWWSSGWDFSFWCRRCGCVCVCVCGTGLLSAGCNFLGACSISRRRNHTQAKTSVKRCSNNSLHQWRRKKLVFSKEARKEQNGPSGRPPVQQIDTFASFMTVHCKLLCLLVHIFFSSRSWCNTHCFKPLFCDAFLPMSLSIPLYYLIQSFFVCGLSFHFLSGIFWRTEVFIL